MADWEGGPRQRATDHQHNTNDPSVRPGASLSWAGTTVYVLKMELPNGPTRRRVFMTRAGAVRAAERSEEDGRAATVTRARLLEPLS